MPDPVTVSANSQVTSHFTTCGVAQSSIQSHRPSHPNTAGSHLHGWM